MLLFRATVVALCIFAPLCDRPRVHEHPDQKHQQLQPGLLDDAIKSFIGGHAANAALHSADDSPHDGLASTLVLANAHTTMHQIPRQVHDERLQGRDHAGHVRHGVEQAAHEPLVSTASSFISSLGKVLVADQYDPSSAQGPDGVASDRIVYNVYNEVQDAADLVSAIMLLSTMAVIVSLFFMVNSSHLQIRSYTWSIIETAVSLVAAIMLSEAGKNCLYLLWRPLVRKFWPVHLFYLVLSVTLLQIVCFGLVDVKGTERHGLPTQNVYTRAFAGIVAKVTGFSCINFFAKYDYNGDDPDKDVIRFGGFHIALAPKGYLLLGAITFFVTMMCVSKGARMILMHFDYIPRDERAQWNTLTSKLEMDASSLTMSFLLSQVCRYFAGGVMPASGGTEHAVGEEPRGVIHTSHEIMLLVFQFLFIKGLVVASGHYKVTVSNETGQTRWIKMTLVELFNATMNKTSGWLLLFTMEWLIFLVNIVGNLKQTPTKADDNCVQVRIFTAFSCTFLAFGLIHGMVHLPSNRYGHVGKGFLRSISFMVGIAWRRAFGLCFDFLVESLGGDLLPFVQKHPDGQDDAALLLGTILCIPMACLMLPALYHFITPSAMLADALSAAAKAKASGEADIIAKAIGDEDVEEEDNKSEEDKQPMSFVQEHGEEKQVEASSAKGSEDQLKDRVADSVTAETANEAEVEAEQRRGSAESNMSAPPERTSEDKAATEEI